MKCNFLILIFAISILSTLAHGQTTVVPDDNFEDYLETHSANGSLVNLGDPNSMGDGIANNNLVLTDRVNSVATLSIIDLEIVNIEGIEDFTSLEILVCNNNRIETVDVSLNFNLELLNVSNNRITGELNVINNVNLESLFCSSNQITTLNLSANTVLKNLDASNNALISLDLSSINSVVCPNPQSDPVTVCQGSATVNVSRNQLSSLIMANGYNDLVFLFNASENPDLFCIQIDTGFTPTGWIKDDWAYYSDNTCVDIYTYVPDDNFEQALIDLGHDDTLDNLVLTENIDTLTDLNVSNTSISNLTGIEDFIALETLNCSINTIESLDLSNNTLLEQLDVSNNSLSILDLDINTALTILNCSNNLINTIDLSNNNALTLLNSSNNELTNLDISNSVLLSDLDCSFNQIETLNTTSNTALVNLLCNNNNLFSLNINNGSNTLITSFNATNNINLFCIKVDDIVFSDAAVGWQKDATASYNIDCGTYIPDDNFEQALIDQGIDSDNTLNNFVATADINTLATPLDISGLAIGDLTGIQDFLALQDLNCSNNNLSALDLNANTALVSLDCSSNQIESLDMTFNTALVTLLCNDNALLNLNIENGNNAALINFNAVNNPNLFCINIDDATIGNIPGTWQKDDLAAYNGDCYNNRFTAIPDAFFEQTLIDLGYDNVIDAQVLTSNIEHITDLDVSDKSISDLTGIRDFQSLMELNCSGNFLDALDVSNMIYLERLNCSSNYLLTNDINNPNGLFNTAGTINLKELYCAGNNLNDLDTSQNTNLELLDCASNNLTILNINNNTLLQTLNCSNNDLSNLDISSNTVLEDINCDSNELNDLTTIGVNNTTLTSLSCANNNLSNLLVNNYEGLVTLNCGSNELTQLNVTSNIALTFLSISINQISNINLLNNLDLVEALVSQNSLSQLDVSANTLLENLNCDFNDINQLDLNTNALLKFLSCGSNELTELDLSDNVDLVEINCNSNELLTLTLSNNLETLKTLNVSNNQLVGDLDLSTMAIASCEFQSNQTEFCPESISINISNNTLSFVNIQNGINTEILNFNSTGNSDLSCIQVDDINSIGVGWVKDDTTEYNIDCNFGETYVPDDNFEQALIDLGYDSLPLDDFVPTANIDTVLFLDINGNAIADLTGIEDFNALEELNCSNNVINDIDLSANVNLLNVDCSNNLITILDVSNNSLITTLNCSNNAIASIDLESNSDLTELNISNNILTAFFPSTILSLQELNIDNNTIVELDFQQNQFLTNISCESNLLQVLNIRNGQNLILENLNAVNNPDLICIETDDGAVPMGAMWSVDSIAQFAINCFFGETYVPDNNFEQALIDLGYDAGPLDDYVITANIEDVNFLDISSLEISDLTGLADFINLTSLNINENSVTEVDLSNNILLVNLNASNNLLTELDISLLPNLMDLNLSNNSIEQLNLDNNINIVDLDVSDNLLSQLSTNGLVNLEDLNCALNQISSLDFSLNPILEVLFCQSNNLVGDQLNLQNGNNANLQIFNATDNPALGCILVDDPVIIIDNVDGTFDDWIKDDSATYQVICEDADNDGVPNEDDLCPNTEFGAPVDLFGCPIIDLPNNNFSILITGETCLNSNNGKITIEALELYNYTVTLIGTQIMEGTGEVFNQQYNFTNDIDILNLLADTYEMCITVAEWPSYQSCYTIVITQPEPLEVFASRTAFGSKIALDMNGSSSYKIHFNSSIFTTHNSSIVLDLQPGINNLKVSTDLDCQGIFEEKIFSGIGFQVFPNPFNHRINIFDGKEGGVIKIHVYSSVGQLVLSNEIENRGRIMTLDTSELSSGIFFMTLETSLEKLTYKILKN
ncbi:T9SS type A sorting domain-containing protein [Winogradskyella sp. PE311]|uniref:T9SS type A sorting domain-containing protein n=1 Tax=Winogradskyella sp. PE311 TaxID=3366943 RepID=UPI00397F0BB7